EHNKSFDDCTALRIRGANDAALGHSRMLQQCALNLLAADIIPCGDNDIISARLEPEVTIFIHQVRVSGDIPAVLYIAALAFISQVATARWSFDGQAAHSSRR